MVWRTIRKELEGTGVTTAAFEANRDFIFDWFVRAVESGAFVEQTPAFDEEDESDEDEDKGPATAHESRLTSVHARKGKIWPDKAQNEGANPAHYQDTPSDDDADANDEDIYPSLHTYEDFLERFPERSPLETDGNKKAAGLVSSYEHSRRQIEDESKTQRALNRKDFQQSS